MLHIMSITVGAQKREWQQFPPLLLLQLLFGFLCLENVLAYPRPCDTPICKAQAEYLRETMNFSANPCDDFYQFACGNFLQKRQIPRTQTRIGLFRQIPEPTQDMMIQTATKFTFASAGQKQQQFRKDSVYNSNTGKYVLIQLKRCATYVEDLNSTNRVDTLLAPEVRKILGHDWEMGIRPSHPHHRRYPTWQHLFVRLFVTGFSSVFQLSVGPNPLNVKRNLWWLEPAPLPLGDRELKHLHKHPRLIAAYKKFITGSARLFHQKISKKQLQRDVNDIISIESHLASAKLLPELSSYLELANNIVTSQKLSRLTGFDWGKRIFKPILKSLGIRYSPAADPDVQILIPELEYFTKAIRLLSELPRRTLLNYAGWRAVWGMAKFSSEEFRQLDFEFRKVRDGVQELPPRGRACFLMVFQQADWGISRFVLDTAVDPTPEIVKRNATKMVNSLQRSFHQLIKQNKWLDRTTKARAEDKLQNVRKNVAYPEWLLSNDLLDLFYDLFVDKHLYRVLDTVSYLRTNSEFNHLQLRKMVDEFPDTQNPDIHWPLSPAILNAAYSPLQNSITMPYEILQFPYFDPRRPYSLNYGAAGAIAGHEFTHGFDNSGRLFDKHGNLHNWWTPLSEHRFKKHAQCFVKQYGKLVEPTTGLRVNGKLTLGENIADNGGVRESFYAFIKHQARDPSPILADLPQFTPSKLFFISYGVSWCSKIRPEKMRKLLLYDPHAPPMFRVNLPLSNFKEFAETFRCPYGSRMNPCHKCQVW